MNTIIVIKLFDYKNKDLQICGQMTKLYETTRLNDVGVRLRHLVAQQVESVLSGLFPNATAYPFGSSVNGFGKLGCDLDLVLRLNDSPKV